MSDYENTVWTNDSWRIEWADEDTIRIKGPYNQVALIIGGDFESMLSALCAAYNEGRRHR